MAKLAESGYRASSIDIKALENYLAVTPKKWAEDALKGMVNKAVKTIMRDWFERYKSTQVSNVSTKLEIIIPAILAMPGFKPYRTDVPSIPQINRKVAVSQEIWSGGFDLQSYELAALNAYYANPEAQLRYFMENKIDLRRKALVKEIENELRRDPNVTEMPAHADDLIGQHVAKPGYKNRIQRDVEMVIR